MAATMTLAENLLAPIYHDDQQLRDGVNMAASGATPVRVAVVRSPAFTSPAKSHIVIAHRAALPRLPLHCPHVALNPSAAIDTQTSDINLTLCVVEVFTRIRVAKKLDSGLFSLPDRPRMKTPPLGTADHAKRERVGDCFRGRTG